MNRRKFTVTAGSLLTASVAGCSGDTDDSSGGGSNGNDDGGSSDNTPEPTPEPTPTPDPVYSIGEAFTVGSGEQTVEYIVNSVNTYNTLGGEFSSEEASGVWVVVQLEMTNQTDETVNISSNHLKLVDDQDRQFDADAGSGIYADQDPRIDAESISFEQLNPGLSTSGTVVFDVNPGVEYELLVEPIGYFSSASSQRVTLGQLNSE